MNDQKNTILAIVLSALVLIGWQIFFGLPQVEKQKQAAQQQQQQQQQTQPTPGTPAPTAPGTAPQAPGQPTAAPPAPLTRDAALAASPRVRLETPLPARAIRPKAG